MLRINGRLQTRAIVISPLRKFSRTPYNTRFVELNDSVVGYQDVSDLDWIFCARHAQTIPPVLPPGCSLDS
jgi:hypothetical protein